MCGVLRSATKNRSCVGGTVATKSSPFSAFSADTRVANPPAAARHNTSTKFGTVVISSRRSAVAASPPPKITAWFTVLRTQDSA